jgi:type II secretion system protein H
VWIRIPHRIARARAVDPARRCRASSAGFTLLEMMVVVIMVGVLVTLAVPAISTQMRDRRTNQAAHEIAMLYRTARALAMGRGSAVMVHYDATGAGRLEMREAQNVTMGSGGCETRLPATSCNADWDAASTRNRLVTSFDPASASFYSNVKLAFFQASGVAVAGIADICFTPLGRPYRRLVAAGTFDLMNEVPYLTVVPVDGAGITRTVLVVPTGASRLAL